MEKQFQAVFTVNGKAIDGPVPLLHTANNRYIAEPWKTIQVNEADDIRVFIGFADGPLIAELPLFWSALPNKKPHFTNHAEDEGVYVWGICTPNGTRTGFTAGLIDKAIGAAVALPLAEAMPKTWHRKRSAPRRNGEAYRPKFKVRSPELDAIRTALAASTIPPSVTTECLF